MSAVAGLYCRDGHTPERAEVDAMLDRLAHRGPDGAGAWVAGPVGLGHRMLFTTEESRHERLPMVTPNGHMAITADARLDNRNELGAALGLTGPVFGEMSDSALILSAYERWGEASPPRLLGDFAFAIWDECNQTLFCVRDPLGVKPFYYHQSDKAFVFASEVKALLSVPVVPHRLNEVRVADHLAGIVDDQSITFYRDVLRLPAGHAMTVGRTGTRVSPYWRLDPTREIRLRSDDEYAAEFRERLAEAVRCRLRSAFPVGSLLSGGLDSSSIVGTARRILDGQGGPRLHTFSAIFPSLPEGDLRRIDERPFVEAVVAGGGLTPHQVRADRLSPLSELDRVLWHEDEAVLAPNLYMHWGLYAAAQGEGIRALLDGVDGDTTVSHGLEYLSELSRTGRFLTLGREVMALSRRYNSSPRSILWQFGLGPLVPDPFRQIWRVARGRPGSSWKLRSAIRPAFARRVGLSDRVRELREDGRGCSARESHCRGLASGLIPYALEVADKAAAAFSLEPRYPFFDRRLIEYCVALPPEQKLHQGWTRMVMRRAMAGVLPEKVRWRVGKANLSPNFNRRLLDGDRDLLDGVIMFDPQVIEDYVDIDALRAAYRRYTSTPTSADDALTVYGAVTLALWLRQAGVAA